MADKVQRRARRTQTEIEAAVLAAVRQCLIEGGYPNLTFERVAEYADVSKHVVYRRYDSRAALALGGVSSFIEVFVSQKPDTGSLRGDLVALFRGRAEGPIQDPGSIVRGILGDAGEAELEQIRGIVKRGEETLEASVLVPARERGEIPVTPPAVLRAFMRLLRDTGLFPDTKESVEELVDDVLLPLLRYKDTREEK